MGTVGMASSRMGLCRLAVLFIWRISVFRMALLFLRLSFRCRYAISGIYSSI